VFFTVESVYLLPAFWFSHVVPCSDFPELSYPNSYDRKSRLQKM